MSTNLTTAEKQKMNKFKLYSEQEFKQLSRPIDRQERLLSAVIDDREHLLSDTDFRYLELLRRAFAVMTNELSPHIRDKKVMRLLQVPSKRRLQQIKEDVYYLFCNVEERNREMERLAMEHKITRLINRLERRDPESKSIPELYKLLDKIKGTSIHEENTIPWSEWTIPLPVYSSNINDFKEKTLDVGHEEIQ